MRTKGIIQLTCKEATLLSIKNEESPLGMWLRLRLQIHLKTCPPCKRFIQQNQILNQGIKQYKNQISIAPQAKLSDEAKMAMQKKIDQEPASDL
jgi:hypothetical protein